MLLVSISLLFVIHIFGFGTAIDIQPWENYLELGSVELPLGLVVNQSSIAHRHFITGYLCLHSFLYDSAQEAFAMAIDMDHTLVEAHIGRLLGHKKSLWSYTNRSGALQVWNETWIMFEENNVTLTQLQSDYLNAAYQWFVYENTFDGEKAFLSSMLNLTRKFPANIDAQTQLGLAYLNVALRETVELSVMEPPSLFEARKVLLAALTQAPSHPGCLHYLIHAFDAPRLVVNLQAVPYAYKYGQVARTASHGQHMPTHTWTHIARLNLNQTQALLSCDIGSRPHSQQWLVYSYLQTGRYMMSINVLNDLMLSNSISSSNNYYLRYIYMARAHIVINVFFWVMHDKDKNREIFVQSINEILAGMNPKSIQMLIDNTTNDAYLGWTEAVARFAECIRLLFVADNDTIGTTSIKDHLSRMTEIASTIKSMSNSTSIRISLLVSQTNALLWCLNASFQNCLTELDEAVQIEASLVNDNDRPYILHIRSTELLAFYLLIIHQHYSTYASTYILNKMTIDVKDFPSYALRLYVADNETDPYRAVNLLGMARAYAQMGRTDQANQLYEKVLQGWPDSSYSSNIDRVVAQEASDYLLATPINETINNAHIHHPSLFPGIFLYIFWLIRH